MNHYTRYAFYLVALAGLLTATVLLARQIGGSEPVEALGPCVLAVLSIGLGGLGLLAPTKVMPDGSCQGIEGGSVDAAGHAGLNVDDISA